ncbi:hypothetical protein C8R45DRAFT_946562 [Mycena sanguinolenta]|nr:hypothetical protein C8R45DRAFT_946562 [Mycena sanguinolenta]
MGAFDASIESSMMLPGFTLMGVIVSGFHCGFLRIYTGEIHALPGREDPLWIKCLVAFLFAINVAQAAAVVYMAWYYCVTNFGNPEIIVHDLWPYSFTGLNMEDILVQAEQDSCRVPKCDFAGCLWIGCIKSWLIFEFVKIPTLQPIVEANLALQCAIDVTIACEMFLGGELNFNLAPHSSHTHLDIVQVQNNHCAHG